MLEGLDYFIVMILVKEWIDILNKFNHFYCTEDTVLAQVAQTENEYNNADDYAILPLHFYDERP